VFATGDFPERAFRKSVKVTLRQAISLRDRRAEREGPPPLLRKTPENM
jgi:hypothetical protein